MIIGLFLGVSLSLLISSLLLIVFKFSNIIVSVPVTGAVIGTSTAGSLILAAFFVSLVSCFFFIHVLRRQLSGIA